MPANDNYVAMDAAAITAEITTLLALFPDLADDEDLRASAVEGETNAYAVLSRLVRVAQQAKHDAAAVADYIGELQARKARFERKNDAMRQLMFRLLKVANLQRVMLPEATVSIGKGRDRVEITDETRLPKWALRVVSSPDKTAIKERLDAGKKVPGAQIVTGPETLTVKVA